MTINNKKINTWQALCRRAWTYHFIACAIVVVAGILYNGGSTKLIPSRLKQEGCSKIMMNVLSSTEDGATICCPSHDVGDAFSLLCLHSHSHPPFSKHLTRFPQAWLLPLAPIILRGLVLIWQTLESHRPSESWSTYFKRFNFYLALLSVRAFILFVGFNWIEDQIIGNPPDECWFSDYRRRGAPSCRGAEFDFSDHTVLFLGQILPIPLAEIAYSWWNPINASTHLSTGLLCGLLYLYAITFLGEFQTAAYYHPPGEILAGYAISLMLQLPLAYLQCFPTWSHLRSSLFGLSSSRIK